MKRTGMRGRLLRGLLVVQVSMGSQAAAQTLWHTPTDGNWSDATRWTGNDVPDTDEEWAEISVCPCQYNVDFDLSATIGGLIMSANFPSVDMYLTVLSGNTLTVAGPTWSVNSGSVRINANARLQCGIPALRLEGNGPLRLLGGDVTASDASYVITNSASKMIKGTGRIICAFVNEGRLEASGSEILQLVGEPKTNRGLITGINFGSVNLMGISVDNVDGVIAGRFGGSVFIASSAVTGGTIVGAGPLGSGPATTAGVTRYSGVTFSESHEVWAGGRMVVLDRTDVHGDILVNRLADPFATALSAGDPHTTIHGPGSIQLNAAASDLDTAQLIAETAGNLLTLAPDMWLQGNGRIRVNATLQGRVAPGFQFSEPLLVGRLDVAGEPVALAASTVLATHLHGAAVGQYDRITSDNSITLDGQLDLLLEVAFAPAFGDEFPIVTAASVTGQFARLNGWELPAGLAWRVRYAPTSATVVVTCPLDLDGDYQIGLGDLAVLLAHFGTTNADAAHGNFDGDTDVDLQDLATLLAAFGTSC